MRAIPVLPLLLLLATLADSAQAQQAAQDPGRAAWQGQLCRNCHGNDGEGGYGPDLAGRGLSAEQFIRAVRHPWGVMPAFTERQVSDQQLATMAALFQGLPKVAAPGAPLWAAVEGAPKGQRVAMQTAGCANCHGPELANPRSVLGGEDASLPFEHFADLVYEHTKHYPDGRMGNFSRDRLPESVLMEIYRYVKDDLGLRAAVRATLDAGAAAGGNTTYTLTVQNRGVKGKGLAVQGMTVTLVVPEGASVANATGAGYQGVRSMTVTRGQPRPGPATVNAAVWRLPALGPEEVQTFKVTLAGAVSGPLPQAFSGSTVDWDSPAARNASARGLAQKDVRLPETGDRVNVAFPPPPRP